jgi:imidazoleglycerol phosphate synthase glutamine amidotransferase subunit HisH
MLLPKPRFASVPPAEIAAADRVVVPGQGAMPDCMRELAARGLRDAVIRAAAEKPFLGICVGLQMLFGHAEEGDVMGLEILPGRVPHFPLADMVAPDGSRLKVPHMGWNQVQQAEAHPVGWHRGRRALLFRAQLLRRARKPRRDRRLDPLRHPLYQRDCAR